MKNFNGKAIYNPSGKAGEYSYWASNFYVGCSNGCTYCYCKKGILAGIMGGDKPILKRCFKDELHALDVFEDELSQNLESLRAHGLFFSFTTDPMLPEISLMTISAMNICHCNDVPVKILTKKTEWVEKFIEARAKFGKDSRMNRLTSIGFTLTGHDELEPDASTNAERIEAMRKLHDAGFKTFASIEPIIEIERSYDMIIQSLGFCDLYKIGLQSGVKYDRDKLHTFLSRVVRMACAAYDRKVYFKDGFLKQAQIKREELTNKNCVDRNYNIFKS